MGEDGREVGERLYPHLTLRYGNYKGKIHHQGSLFVNWTILPGIFLEKNRVWGGGGGGELGFVKIGGQWI